MEQVQRFRSRPLRDPLARLANGRVVAVDERNRGLEARSRRGLDELPRAGGVERQGLLADDVLAGGQRRLGKREMEVVRRADVDDVD